jgi:prepilin-type N-terminal cleavage/methylation domain-containing protein
MSMKQSRTVQDGFSLVELMVAMVVTLIISGAIYGLMASSQTAFKTQPEVSDMQQNARVAMDLIQRDILSAGVGMGGFFQVFGDALDAQGAVGGSGAASDHLLVFTNSGDCPDMQLKNGPCPGPDCATGGVNSANLNSTTPVPDCFTEDAFVLVQYQTGGMVGGKWGYAANLHSSNPPTDIGFPNGQSPGCGGGPPGCPPNLICTPASLASYSCNLGATDRPFAVTHLEIIRYEIAVDPVDNIPGLWRSNTGGMTPGGAGYVPAPGPGGNWELMARGVDDLQVEYLNGAGAFAPVPGVVALGNWPSVIREVRVTLWARAATLKGVTDATGVSRYRMQLTSTSTPRATMAYMSQVTPPLWQ